MNFDKLPGDYRATLATGAVVIGLFLALDARVVARAEEATDKRVTSKWAAELRAEAVKAATSAATEAAKTAASEAARSAVKEAVAEVVKDLEVHKEAQRIRDEWMADRLERLERKPASTANGTARRFRSGEGG